MQHGNSARLASWQVVCCRLQLAVLLLTHHSRYCHCNAPVFTYTYCNFVTKLQSLRPSNCDNEHLWHYLKYHSKFWHLLAMIGCFCPPTTYFSLFLVMYSRWGIANEVSARIARHAIHRTLTELNEVFEDISNAKRTENDIGAYAQPMH